jgi:D-3-phosphoglycerate dehydrogenase
MALKVLLSAPYIIPIVDRFRSIFEGAGISLIIPHVEERLSEEGLLPYAGEIDGVICGDDHFTARVLEQSAPRLKVISKWGTGIDSIDHERAAELGIEVCNTPGAFIDPVADSVMAYILAFARMLPWIDQAMKAGQWAKIPGRSLAECTLGVVGVGKIGKAVLHRARAFGMRLLGNDIIEIEEDFIRQVGVEMMPLPVLLAASDFVSTNCDLNQTSYHLLDRETFSYLQPQAVVINTARGPVVDEGALIEALQEGRIAGAGLDVFEDEPLPMDSPLRTMDNVLLAPHNANSSPQAWERVHENTIRNLFQGLGLEWEKELYKASE